MKSKTIDKTLAGLDPRVAALAKALNKKHGSSTITSMHSAPTNTRGYINSGNPIINVILSKKSELGFAMGRIYELYGGEHIGKSTLGMTMMSRCQRSLSGIGYVIDTENGWDKERTLAASVDPSRTLYCDEEFTEYILDEIRTLLIKNGKTPCAIVWDTVAGSTPKSLDGTEIGRGRRGAHAGPMSEGLPKLTKILGRSNAVLLLINQMRDGAIGDLFANKRDKESVKGGKASKFQSAARIRLDYQGDYYRQIKGKHVLHGMVINVTTSKNRHAPNDVRAKLVFQTRGLEGGRFNNALSCLYTLYSWSIIKKQKQDKKFTFAGQSYSPATFEQRYKTDKRFQKFVHKTLDRSFARLFMGEMNE